MKRQTFYELIKSHFDQDERNFLKAAREISNDLSIIGDKELSLEINKLIRKKSSVVLSQSNLNIESTILNEEQNKWMYIIKRGFNNQLLNKVFLYGKPGTGKTSFVSLLANELLWDMESLSLSHIIDSKLGESMKLLDKVFLKKGKRIIFIDEVDSIASKRGLQNDVFEISRVLNHLLQLIDKLDNKKILIVATNMESKIDSAFIRRFDLSLNFNNYNCADLVNIFEKYVEKYSLHKFDEFITNLKKLIIHTYKFWTPGYIKRVCQISSLWLYENEVPRNQIIEILKLIKIGNNKKDIEKKIKDQKVPIRTINYFMGDN